MSDDRPVASRLAIRVVYVDLPDLIEVEVQVLAEGWAGVARVYASPDALCESARGLREWSYRPEGEFIVAAGNENWGCFSLRCYPRDGQGHIACRVELAAADSRRRRSEIWRLAVVLSTEVGLVEQFAHQLASVAEQAKGEVVLSGLIT